MADSKSSVLKQIKVVAKAASAAAKSKKVLTGQLKDSFADKLDKIGEKVDNLKDKKTIDAATAQELKEALKHAKSQLDVDLDD